MRSADTSAQAQHRQLEVYRAMSPARRVEAAVQMSDEVWEMAADGIRARHPDYDPPAVRWALLRLRVGDDMFPLVWPGAPVLAP